MVTEFQEKVYCAVRRIPRGRVTTYKLLAESLGCRSPRAVGQALRRNPFATEVPCHRVIASDLSPGGFRGGNDGASVSKKLGLLEKEGVPFKNGKLARTNLVYRFSSSSRSLS